MEAKHNNPNIDHPALFASVHFYLYIVGAHLLGFKGFKMAQVECV